MFKTNFLNTTKLWEALLPNAPRVYGPGQNRRQKVFH